MPRLVLAWEEQAWNQHQLAVNVHSACAQIWSYRRPAVVLGCSQRGSVSSGAAFLRAKIDLVERRAGGGAVLTGPWMLSASVVLPSWHPLVVAGPIPSYRWIGELYQWVLRGLGIPADALTPEQTRRPEQQIEQSDLEWACYGGISPWEVVVGKRKIVGLAQVRKRTGVLLVAGLLLDRPDWRLLCTAMDKPVGDADELARRTTSCAEQCGREFSLQEVAYPLALRLQEAVAISLEAEDSKLPTQERGAVYS